MSTIEHEDQPSNPGDSWTRPLEDSEVALLHHHFYTQAENELGEFVEPYDGLSHFKDSAQLDARTAPNIPTIEELDHIATPLISNYATDPEKPGESILDQFMPYEEALDEALVLGPLFVIGNHPTFSTPIFNMRSFLEYAGHNASENMYCVTGPFPLTMRFPSINSAPLESINAMSNTLLTVPLGSSGNKGELRQVSKVLTQRFARRFAEIIEHAAQHPNAPNPTIFIKQSGTRDKDIDPSLLDLPENQRVKAVQKSHAGLTSKLLIAPGRSFAVVGTHDEFMDPDSSSISSSVHRKLRIFHIFDGDKNSAGENQYLLVELTGDPTPRVFNKKTDILRYFERMSVDLANNSAKKANSTTRYVFSEDVES